MWTAVIVAQVAFTIFCPLVTLGVQREAAGIRAYEVGFPADEYLSAWLRMDPEPSAAAPESSTGTSHDSARAERQTRVRATFLEMERRLAAEPGVAGVTFASTPPGTSHPWRRMEVDEGGAVPPWSPPGYRVRVASVAVDYFDVLGTPITSGRDFEPGDVESGRAVVVNQFVVERVLGGRNPIGRRVRYLPEDPEASRSPDDGPEPWYEIVGVVDGLRMNNGANSLLVAGLFHPVAPAAAGANRMVVHVRGNPASFAPRLRRIATEVDPTLRLARLLPLDQIRRADLRFYDFWMWLTGGLTVVVLVLSWAGIYAVLSFNVARRTREIGVRVALGGDARRIILAIFRRPLAQVALGVGIGAILIFAVELVVSDPGRRPTPWEVAMLGAYATVMMGACMLACIVPAWRALRVEPTEALRAE